MTTDSRVRVEAKEAVQVAFDNVEEMSGLFLVLHSFLKENMPPTSRLTKPYFNDFF